MRYMSFDFDQVIDRHNTYCTQWDYIADRFGCDDVLPFSISDSDFAVPPEIVEALQNRLTHPLFGYTRWNHDDFKTPIVQWFERRGGARVISDWIVYSPSVIFTVAALIRILSRPGDSVVTFTPLYDGFYGAICANDREIAPVYIASANEGYSIDFDALYMACSDERSKVLLLTKPHNPTGKVFTKEELNTIVSIAKRTNTFIISDDIHRDIILGDIAYTPITDITTRNVALACSASKTFNTAGLICSYAFIPDTELRSSFLYELKNRNALSSASILGMYAQMVAYTKCDYYVNELSRYIYSNMSFIKTFIDQNIPRVSFEVPQGTYLAWIDISNLNVRAQRLQIACVEQGKVGIMSGATYGEDHFMRMCVACPQVKLTYGLTGLLKGVQSL